MNDTIGYCAIMISAGLVVTASLTHPNLLSDNNVFLKDFVGGDLLSVLGVIVTITIASASGVHLELNKAEERAGQRDAFQPTRSIVKRGAYCLIALLLMAGLLIAAKSMVPQSSWGQSLFNGAALVVVLWSVLILFALTQLVFKIKPKFEMTMKRDEAEFGRFD